MSETIVHQPVLLNKVLEVLALRPGEILLDATVNRGGHSLALCQSLGETGRVIGIDADTDALQLARTALQTCPCSVTLLEGNFRELGRLLDTAGIGQIDAALFDLGLSSEQLADSGRGFSFQTDEPLLMTLASQPGAGALTASEIVNHWSEETLADIIFAYGEERFARRIAREIVQTREQQPLATTGDLVAAINRAVPLWYRRSRRHPATKTFQALRIAVNDELHVLTSGLAAAWARLRTGGRLAVISFHSLEARTVKQFYRERVADGSGRLLTARASRPDRVEILANPRSRSAQLRLLIKN